MRRLYDFGMGVGAALLLGWCVRGVPAGAEGGEGAATAPTMNGDVNGDGVINLTDAVYLLNFLFKGGPAILEIDCKPPDNGPKPSFRFLNTLVCGTDNFEATLTLCGATASDRSDNGNLSTLCRPFTANPSCAASVTANTGNCGSIALCGNFPAESGHVYDFVLTIISAADPTPIVIWFDQLLDAQGNCPPFAPPTMQATGALTAACAGAAGAGAGGGLGAGGFKSLGFGAR